MALYECSYLLERVAWPTNTVIASLSLPFVQSLRVVESPALDFAYTLGTVPYRRSGGKLRNNQLVVTGRSGVDTRLGKDAKGAALFDDGPTLYAELRSFINGYLDLPPEVFPVNRLILRALAEGDEWYVEPMDRVSERNVQTSRFSWLYTLPFRAYQRADARVLTGLAGFFASLKSMAKAATKAVNSVTLYVAEANQTLKDTRAAFAAFMDPIRAVGRMMEEVRGVALSAQALEQLPADYLRAILDVVDQGLAATAEVLLTVPYADRGAIEEAVVGASGAMGEVRRSMLEVVGLRRPTRAVSSTATTLAGATPSTAVTLSALALAHVVRAGETLESVAAAAGTTADVLATLNGMSDYQTMPNGTPFGPGVAVLVPAIDGFLVPTSGPSSDVQTWQSAEAFGVGLMLGPDGDLVLVGNDVARLQGPSLLAQALKMRCTTELGTHGVFPGYGIIPLVGEGTVAGTTGRLASNVREQILRDTRVSSVRRVTVQSVQAGGYVVSAEVGARGGPTFNLALPVGV